MEVFQCPLFSRIVALLFLFNCQRWDYISATLEDFCRENHLKTYTVSRLLKKHTAKTFKELLKERKLQQAAYLLRNTTLSTEKIFHIIGYENSSFFHKIFREKYGKPPKEYRFQ